MFLSLCVIICHYLSLYARDQKYLRHICLKSPILKIMADLF